METKNYEGFSRLAPPTSRVSRCGSRLNGLRCGSYTTVRQPARRRGGRARCKYQWADRGRAVYCAWWEERDARHYKDLERARDAIRRLSNSDWWDWSDGSAPAHWKWPEWYQEIIRDGLPIWFKEAPRQWRRPQSAGKNKVEHAQMREKLDKVRNRRYVQGGTVHSLTSFLRCQRAQTTYEWCMMALAQVSTIPFGFHVSHFRRSIPCCGRWTRTRSWGTWT